jgi:hypothetical protein
MRMRFRLLLGTDLEKMVQNMMYQISYTAKKKRRKQMKKTNKEWEQDTTITTKNKDREFFGWDNEDVLL